MDTQDTNYGLQQAAAQLSCIREMVAALECDYDRLKELRGMNADGDTILDADEAEELAALEDAAGECSDREEAEQRIQEDPLSVQIRSGWYSPGETPEPEEFCILLCTGGPAVRILGELNEHGEPSRAWLEYQDWGTPWTHYFEEGSAGVLLTYCQQFFFGA